MNKYLLYIPTPDGSHGVEINDSRNFDVCLNEWAFGDHCVIDEQCQYQFCEPGNMWPTIPKVLKQLPREYDAYAFFCDDVEITTATLNRLFDEGIKWGYELWQASLLPDSYVGWNHTITRGEGGPRLTNFVECMMPFFTRKALQECLWTFGESESGWGIDYLWPTIIEAGKMAIFDNLTARVTRPQSSHAKVFCNGLTGPMERELLNRKFQHLENKQNV